MRWRVGPGLSESRAPDSTTRARLRPVHERIPFGQSISDGLLYEPLEVPLGLQCGCVCPACREPIIAKHCLQSSRVAYFSHRSHAACSTGFETAVHLAAKQLIAQRKAMHFPLLDTYVKRADVSGRHHYAKATIFPSGLTCLSKVQDEVWLENMRPDLLVDAGVYGTVLVEIAVTHFVDPVKLTKIVDRNVAAVEIDLSAMKTVNLALLAAALFDSAPPTSWLHHPQVALVQSELYRQLDAEIMLIDRHGSPTLDMWEGDRKAAMAAHADRERQAEEKRRVVEVATREQLQAKAQEELRRRNLTAAFKTHTEAGKRFILNKWLGGAGLPKLLAVKVRGDKSFDVADPLIWQTALFLGCMHNRPLPAEGYLTKEQALRWLEERFYVTPVFHESAQVAIWHYLMGLVAIGALFRWEKSRFMIGVVSLGALHALRTVAEAADTEMLMLSWSGEVSSFQDDATNHHIARAMLGTDVLPSSWVRLVAKSAMLSALTPQKACREAESYGVPEKQAWEFFARSGMLRIDGGQEERC